jgi:hypothetical protein
VPRPAAEAEGCRTKNIMKRICIISLSILLLLLLSSCGATPTAKPTRQPGTVSLDMAPECVTLEQGLCIVSEPGESLGEGKTTIIDQKPEATFLGQSTALQIKVEDWTLVFDPGQGTPFSLGMTFPNAKLYPQGSNAGMTIEHAGKKCSEVEGAFVDDILQSGQNGGMNTNPVSAFDIRFAMRCDKEPQVLYGRVKLPF